MGARETILVPYLNKVLINSLKWKKGNAIVKNLISFINKEWEIFLFNGEVYNKVDVK